MHKPYFVMIAQKGGGLTPMLDPDGVRCCWALYRRQRSVRPSARRQYTTAMRYSTRGWTFGIRWRLLSPYRNPSPGGWVTWR